MSVEELDSRLAELAHTKTIVERSVVIAQGDLERHHLTSVDVQDLVFAVIEMSGRLRNSSLVGVMIFYFHHQSVQVRAAPAFWRRERCS